MTRSKSQKQNPYNPAIPASAKMFVGRDAIRRQIAAGMRGGGGIELIGAPGLGKTSLLLAVARELTSEKNLNKQSNLLVPVYVECVRGFRDIGDILVLIIKNLSAALKSQRDIACPARILKQAVTDAGQGSLESALKLILEWAFSTEKRTHQPVLLLDDLHRISERPLIDDLISILKTLINHQQLSLVFASKHTLSEELRNDVSPIRPLISQQHVLEPLSRQETHTLIAKARSFGWSIDDGFAEIAFEFTNGHPYRLHYYLYGVLLDDGKLTVKGLRARHTPTTIRHLNTMLQQEEEHNRMSLGVTQSDFTIFISYAHKDNEDPDPSKRWLDRLLEHLQPLVMQNKVNAWSDVEIETGEQWHGVIQTQLQKANVAILLISPSFLASKYIRNSELPALLMNAKNRGVTILPIILRRCLFSETKFKYPNPEIGPEEESLSIFQSANSSMKPLNAMKESEQDNVLVSIAQRILKITQPNI